MDARDYNYYPISIEQDHEKKLLVLYPGVDNIEIPARYAVCPVCHGRGSYVNPSIDSHGLTADDFAEDPDFAEDYLRGTYDVTCRSCGGRNVILVPIDADGQRRVDEILDEESAYGAEFAAERRMGA